jgi:hypothetical protein
MVAVSSIIGIVGYHHDQPWTLILIKIYSHPIVAVWYIGIAGLGWGHLANVFSSAAPVIITTKEQEDKDQEVLRKLAITIMYHGDCISASVAIVNQRIPKYWDYEFITIHHRVHHKIHSQTCGWWLKLVYIFLVPMERSGQSSPL